MRISKELLDVREWHILRGSHFEVHPTKDFRHLVIDHPRKLINAQKINEEKEEMIKVMMNMKRIRWRR